MIVTRAQLDLVEAKRCQRLVIPVTRGAHNQLLPCPLEVGKPVKLQTEMFKKGTAITPVEIVAVDPSLIDGPRVVVGTVGGLGWLVTFVLGNHGDVFRRHREQYLNAKGVGLTDDPRRAVHGEPAVTSSEQLVISARARERRAEEKRAWLAGHVVVLEERRRVSDDEVEKRMLKRNIRNVQMLLKALTDCAAT